MESPVASDVPTPTRTTLLRDLVLAISVVALAIVLVGWSSINTLGVQSSPTSDPAAIPDESPTSLTPTTLVVYLRYPCYQCDVSLTDLLQELTSQSGEVPIVYQPVHLTDQDSALMAQAAWCSQEQQLFEPYHTRLSQASQRLDQTTLSQIASDVGIDPVAFTTCIDATNTHNQIQWASDQAQQYGITTTPAIDVVWTVTEQSDIDALKPQLSTQEGHSND
ncbi:MAG: thioredoxin domain-containing protein [Chloroflexota bacterium]